MHSNYIIVIGVIYLALQSPICEARRRRYFHVADAFTYEQNIKIYGSTLTATIDVTHFTEPEKIVEVDVARGTSYEGQTLVNFNNGVIATKSSTLGSCAIMYNHAENVKTKEKATVKKLKDAKTDASATVMPGAVCKTYGTVKVLSPYGNRISTMCHSLDNTNVLINFCRYATEDENEAYTSKCDVGFVYIDGNVELACIRAWL